MQVVEVAVEVQVEIQVALHQQEEVVELEEAETERLQHIQPVAT
jgi:hypothetical protein